MPRQHHEGFQGAACTTRHVPGCAVTVLASQVRMERMSQAQYYRYFIGDDSEASQHKIRNCQIIWCAVASTAVRCCLDL